MKKIWLLIILILIIPIIVMAYINGDVAAIALYALGIKIPAHFEAKVPDNLFNK